MKKEWRIANALVVNLWSVATGRSEVGVPSEI
jgi:hypothetical protein